MAGGPRTAAPARARAIFDTDDAAATARCKRLAAGLMVGSGVLRTERSKARERM